MPDERRRFLQRGDVGAEVAEVSGDAELAVGDDVEAVGLAGMVVR